MSETLRCSKGKSLKNGCTEAIIWYHLFRNSQPNKQMCDDFPHFLLPASSWLKVLKSSQVGPNWFKSHDVAACALRLPKCWRFGYCLELTCWVPARKVLEFDHCIGWSGPLHWRGRRCPQVRIWVEPTHGQQRSRWCLSERKDSDLWGNPPVVKSEFE